jgi:hypothetical protein
MLNLFELAQEMQEVFDRFIIDEETGEILNIEILEAATADFETKVKNTGLYIKSLEAETAAIKEEARKLSKRAGFVEKKAARLADYLAAALQAAGRDEGMRYPNLVLSFRKSKAVDVDPEFLDYAIRNHLKQYLSIPAPSISKAAIKAAIEQGRKFKYARIINKNNLQIK